MKSHPRANILRRGGFVIGLAAMLVVAAGGAGMAAAAPDPSSGLHTVTPVRVLDTRSGLGAPQAPLGPQSTLDMDVSGLTKAATAVVVNVTAVNGTANSFLTISATGDRPITSTINWNTGYAVANGATVALNDSRHVSIFNAAGKVDVIVDLIGYYTQGSPGPTGPTGPAGPAGVAGPAGATGAVGLPGAVGAAGGIGPIGPIGVTGADGAPGGAGPTGGIGPIGPIGLTGADGAPGGVGATGGIGPIGPIGVTGADGAPGGVGATGDIGPIGPAGTNGADGAPGGVGATGNIGPIGAPGADGATGAVGPAGPAGDTGAVGMPGPTGLAGADGAVGPAGATGADGTPGDKGPAGPAGADGAVGPAGKDGTSAGPAGSVYLQAFNSTAETIHRAPSGDVLTFGTVGNSAGGITFTAGQGSFVLPNAGVYKVTFSITAMQPNQFDIRVNGGQPGDGVPSVFGSAGGQPNVGTAILTLASGDIVTLENLTSTGATPPAPAAAVVVGVQPLVAGDVTLAAQTGGTANSVNASIVIEELNAPVK